MGLLGGDFDWPASRAAQSAGVSGRSIGGGVGPLNHQGVWGRPISAGVGCSIGEAVGGSHSRIKPATPRLLDSTAPISGRAACPWRPR